MCVQLGIDLSVLNKNLEEAEIVLEYVKNNNNNSIEVEDNFYNVIYQKS